MALNGLGGFALAHLAFAGGLEENREVGEDRLVPAEGADDVHVQRHRGQPLRAADDVGDAHQVIVEHGGEVVCGQAVRLEQHRVIEGGIRGHDRTS